MWLYVPAPRNFEMKIPAIFRNDTEAIRIKLANFMSHKCPNTNVLELYYNISPRVEESSGGGEKEPPGFRSVRVFFVFAS